MALKFLIESEARQGIAALVPRRSLTFTMIMGSVVVGGGGGLDFFAGLVDGLVVVDGVEGALEEALRPNLLAMSDEGRGGL